MRRYASRSLALAGGLAFAAAFAAVIPGTVAAAPTAFYHAELAAPLDAPRKEVVNGVVWRCEDSSCFAAKTGARPEILCGRLARKVGPIASFSHGGNVLDQTALSRCNKD